MTPVQPSGSRSASAASAPTKEAGSQAFESNRAQLAELFKAAFEGDVAKLEGLLCALASEGAGTRPASASPSRVSSLSAVARTRLASALPEFRDGRRRTALHFACAGGRRDAAALLLSLSPALAEARDEAQESPLFLLLRRGGGPPQNAPDADDAILNMLLERGADVNAKNADGLTPLHVAVGETDGEEGKEIAKKLISAGAQVNAPSTAFGSPLQHAVLSRRMATAELLLGEGADPNGFAQSDAGAASSGRKAPETRRLPPPLVFVSSAGDAAAVRLLLGAGADPNRVDADGWTALQCAAEAGSEACVKALLDAGADANVCTQGLTALDLALQYRHTEVAALLRSVTTRVGSAGEQAPKEAVAAERGAEKKEPATSEQACSVGAAFVAEYEAEEKPAELTEDEKLKIEETEQKKKHANRLVADGDYQQALADYLDALEICPRIQQTRHQRATLHANSCLMLLNLKLTPEKALEHAGRAVALDPEWVRGYYRAGQALVAMGDHAEAAQLFWQALLRDSGNEDIS
ncbi:tetratricopeptide repeat-containing protein [Besnoitia besnoiti]|uniref:Tetratricopeptide repeat-containing protein n=1 Tax=Besnoitia besnoiti TaxID=94643 RepID=A0A2A9MH50_BESBE|nr:tetratricopeptide repeat-containing protein [Besnoitia besnoiti]PFH34917.1 tetratricopeptide repeat-containing protein [Besnoitia besnoiti]